MIKRYSNYEISAIWERENILETWLKVELLVVEAFVKLKIIPVKEGNKIINNAKINIPLMNKIEKETHHDVIAFIQMLTNSLGNEKKWIHYGLTSTDVVDTSYGILYQQSNIIIEFKIKKLIKTIKKLALKYKKTPCIGRTHGVHAEITSFGLKMALWYDEMLRNLVRFQTTRKIIEAGKISGAVGNFANTKPFVQDYVCRKLKIRSVAISTQIIQRDNHAEYFNILAIIGSSLEKFATEIRHLQKTEVQEVFESFSKGQKGSSAMPHKQNPIKSENICGLARVLRGYGQIAMENQNLWHERDISHSSAERIISADATILIEYMLTRFNNILGSLVVNEKAMLTNINLTNGTIFSQRILLALIEKGFSREKAYALVQPIALKAFNQKLNFKQLLNANPEINLTTTEINQCFNIDYYLQEVDTIFKRVKIL